MSESYADLGPNVPATRSTASTASQCPVNPAILRTVTELGYRYRPLSTADQQAHAAQVSLLARDLAGHSPALVEQAANDWARSERFMPKAAELLAIIRRISPKAGPDEGYLHTLAAKYNSRLERRDVQWVVRFGDLHLERI